ncbi:hypothetical protein PHLGIDRAFT_128329 [Phlebiopsis gigantea 11061_1 CR5-6]|uniref:Mediator of RNA polymerase II transcription subunit 9 n=1 Tax=Phlebiopsis gigantea (strain 11061_1 CR5-6) TaxID=745531 RepID=A0A0C3RX59_PHLG1|nr:hypothetical protein PHLGIDRAFT_128329 [Phlebiopsis gigantea 11061_1 CR5-6]
MSTSLFEKILPEVTSVLEVIHETEVAATPQAKRKLVQVSNGLRDDLNRAKEYATHLEGGDLSLAEQEEITTMLTKLISRKKDILRRFAADINTRQTSPEVQMEVDVDSTASTPAY